MIRKPKLEGLTFEQMPFPEDVIVETFAYCNLRCIMCPYPFLKRPKGEMEFSVFRKIVDEVAKENPNGRFWLAILGEPLLGENLFKMLHYARDAGLTNIHLNTNAMCLTQEKTHALLESGIDKLLVSLDAFTKETYDQIRIGGDFDAVVRNLEYFLVEKARLNLEKPDVIAQYIIMDQNAHEVEQFKNFWLPRGAIVKIRLKMGWGKAVEAEDLNAAVVERSFPCPWLLRSVSIHWDGKFAQCDADYEAEHSPGDIRIQTIKEIWDGELAMRRARNWALDFSQPPCDTCKDWSVGRSEWYYPDYEKTD